MKKYICRGHIRHNGKDYGEGDLIELDEGQAESLESLLAAVKEEKEAVKTPQPEPIKKRAGR